MDNYEIIQPLYSSTKSQIFKVRSKQDNHIYVIKSYNSTPDPFNEIKMHKLVSNNVTFIPQIYECFKMDQQVILVMQYYNQLNLGDYISDHMGNPIQERIVIRFMIQLTYTLLYFNYSNILHRCLTPENILVTQKSQGDEIGITDFGMAIKKDANTQQPVRPSYLPPEFLFKNEFTQKSQLYQMGLILYQITASRPLFQVNESSENIKNLIRKEGIHLKQSLKYSPQLRSLVKLCLNFNDKERPTIKQFYKQPSNQLYKLIYQAFQSFLKQYEFNYDQQQNLNKWLQPTLMEMQKKQSIIIPDSNFLQTQTQSQQEEPPKMQELKSPRKYKLKIQCKSQQQMREQKQTSQPSPLIMRQVYSRNSDRVLKQQRLITRPNTTNNFILRKVKTVQEFSQRKEDDQKEKKKTQQSINKLIKMKYEHCQNEIGCDMTQKWLQKIQFEEVEDFQKEYRLQNIWQHLNDIGELENVLKEL